MAEIYSFVGVMTLFVAVISFLQWSRAESSSKWKKILIGSGSLFVLMMLSDTMLGIMPPSEPTKLPASGVQESAEPAKPTAFERSEESFYAESYEAIARKTGLRVTERWLLEYGERVGQDGNVDTHGFVELNGDGVKRQFWLMFDGQSRRVLRVKIDADLIYSEVGW